MGLDYDERTGRPLVDGRERIEELSEDGLELEVAIAAAEPGQRAGRLDALLFEHAPRQSRGEPPPA